MIAHIIHSRHWSVRLVQLCTALYVAVFTSYALMQGNYEFLFYLTYLVGFVFVIPYMYRYIHMPVPLLAGMSVFMFLHVAGGFVYIDGIRLYDFEIVPALQMHYDNLIHMCGGFISCLAAYSVYRAHLDEYVTHNMVTMGAFLLTYANGMGVYNELIELLAVIYLNAGEAVGDYMNNAIDLVCNSVGALLGILFVWFYYRKYLRR